MRQAQGVLQVSRAVLLCFLLPQDLRGGKGLMDIREFQQKQQLPYEAKVAHAEVRAWEFYRKITGEYGADCHVSVGGLDSITLLCFLRSIGIDVPAVSVSILEDKGNQEVHKQLGVISIPPYMSKTKVLQ